MANKLPTQQEVKLLGDKAFNQLIKSVDEGGFGLSEAAARELTKNAGIYETTTVYATDTAPHHKAGEPVFCSKALAEKMLANGWATETAAGAKAKKEKEV